MSAITFREEDHTYWQGSRRLPSVTEVLKPLYGDLRFVGEDILNYKRDLGVAVHKAVELHVLGGLRYDSLVPPVSDHFEQYLLWEAEIGFTPRHSELLVHSALGYAGTLDLQGDIALAPWLVDLKCTAALSPAVKLQLAAYQQAYIESHGGAPGKVNRPRRAALRLSPNRYHWTPYPSATDQVDLAGFAAFLNAHKWCAANGSNYHHQTQEVTA